MKLAKSTSFVSSIANLVWLWGLTVLYVDVRESDGICLKLYNLKFPLTLLFLPQLSLDCFFGPIKNDRKTEEKNEEKMVCINGIRLSQKVPSQVFLVRG